MTRIQRLPPETAKLIAAGEVIERPQSVLRELLDNALDAGAANISVSIRKGGTEAIQVKDDGSGMSEEDLALSVEPHATSKLHAIDDLLSLHTLGFRGEALASIAAVAELEILSAAEHGRGSRLVSFPGEKPIVETAGTPKGTIVNVRNIFANFPARRQFLKFPHAEALACKQILAEKAVPFHDVSFRFDNEGSVLVIPPGTLKTRAHNLLFHDLPSTSAAEIPLAGTSFRGSIVTVSPSFTRKDRRLMQVFVNNRKIQEFALVQALEYAFREQLPGGAYPCAAVFLSIDASLVDFNIHPAKKEARIRNIDDLRSGIIAAVRHFLRTLIPGRDFQDSSALDAMKDNSSGIFSSVTGNDSEGNFTRLSARAGDAEHEVQRHFPDFAQTGSTRTVQDPSRDHDPGILLDQIRQNRLVGRAPHIDEFRERQGADLSLRDFTYFGQLMKTFLVFERENKLYLLDQHAAHERILFDKLMERKTETQELLVPYTYISQSEDEDKKLLGVAEGLAEYGLVVRKEQSVWQLETIPAFLSDRAAEGLFSDILEKGSPEAALRHVLATVACRAAIKEGDELYRDEAVRLIEEALLLKDPHCPHGRPIWIELTEKELYTRIGRIV